MFKKIFFSLWMSIILLFLYAFACAVATFIENDFGTNVAKALIYNALWFDLLHLILIVNLIGVIVIYKFIPRKKYAILLLHCSFIMILIGAGITRYFGLEGGMHIREGEKSNILITRDEILSFMVYNDIGKVIEYFSFPINLHPLFKNHFEQDINLKDNKVNIKLKSYTKAQDKESLPIIEFNINYKGDSKDILLLSNYNNENVIPFRLADKIFALNLGPKEIQLPFSLTLNQFILERYAGSMSPSSYASDIIVNDNNQNFEYKIFMNNVLDYGGYRFFQSSYDEDEKGTILSVNKDPGKIPTYIGYTLLIIGFLWVIFDKNSRFLKLSSYLKNQKNLFLFCILLLSLQNFSFANEEKDSIINTIKSIKQNSNEHSKIFSSLLVQDFDGRIKPIDTLAMNFIHKITKRNSFLGLNYNQIFLGMMIYPKYFKQVKMIPIKTDKLKQILGINNEEKYASYNDTFDGNFYKIINYVQEANRKKPNLRTQFDKDILALDEKINLAFYIYSGEIFRIFPDPSFNTTTWYSPATNMPFKFKDIQMIQNLMYNYFLNFNTALEDNNFTRANESLINIKKFQEYYGEKLLPSPLKIKMEIFLNHFDFFKNLGYIYLSFGILLFVLIFYEILKNKNIFNTLKKIIVFLTLLAILVHIFALILRWYIGDHAPWSNAYESMIYIALACIICGFMFYKKSILSLCVANIMAGISLFVAHLGFMDPQITNLVPVLKSYWLNIHVSIITASYGFLAFCFFLGVFSLVLFILRNSQKPQIDQSILNIHCINEMAMIIALALLTIGNFLGGVWANESWGRYWGWDSKETWALISIIIYTIILHLRLIPKLNSPFVFASASILGFYSILMTYFGVNFYLSGLHSYASGDPIPVPKFLYFFIIFTFALIILAFFKRKLKSPI
ncbi:cytochrome C biogenesis protein [Campylobacter novaezeelandiae]|uniref:cytochrome c biogenesis protein n=1 Tax=Campylobacter novaezeelandiae TaxID=2267891 RepID=UPI0010376595|nr:cytochrome c biogenesis protein CcsA [Campylobacter novaezeelandiae]QWU79859.1 cytochrome c synthetase [Campylobacter novaezeelandiae]TBR77978.1 cytochrome C biogenesis protein [Campylobacter novaezeelandiae]